MPQERPQVTGSSAHQTVRLPAQGGVRVVGTRPPDPIDYSPDFPAPEVLARHQSQHVGDWTQHVSQVCWMMMVVMMMMVILMMAVMMMMMMI